LDVLRSKRWRFWRNRCPDQTEETVLALAPATSPDAEDLIFARQIAQRLSEALGKLSPRQRTVFVLRHYDDRSLEEIGEIVSLEIGTVKAHLARALSKLREELRDLYGRPALER
jgi:RNA polymerase sigma-70 factor (ECF subfamily)